ncbi:MAG: Flp pilus assembly complex ATPase component TadA [Elusimicrobia bacterium]|nr:Flp pilus assembly complex ATPase component TadA [Elusimicrobiota bacterium]
MEEDKNKKLALRIASLLDDVSETPEPRGSGAPSQPVISLRPAVVEALPAGADLGSPAVQAPSEVLASPEVGSAVMDILPIWADPDFPAEQAVPAPAEGAAASAAPKRSVLVVDDDRDYRRMVRALLSGNGYDVYEAEDGRRALQLIALHRPDLVLVDFNMPRMNGYEMIQEVRSRFETRAIPIIMFTGASNRSHLRSLGMAISDFLEKPVSNVRLLESISSVLGAEPSPELMGAESAPSPRIVAPPKAPETTPSPKVVAAETMAEKPPAAPAEPAPTGLPPEPLEEGDEDGTELLQIEEEKKEEERQEVISLEHQANESPVISQVNRILVKAVGMRASDIHIEPQEKHITVRVRVDGTLKLLCTLPLSIHPRLSARIKIMSSLVITERRLPQDGQFKTQIRGSRVEFRVSTLPCLHGEKIVMRILGTSKLNADLAQMSLRPRDLGCVERALRTPHGLILVTGPTGSGKTTTLYTMISVLNKPEVNILTAEDPVEYEVPDISQVKVLPSIGLTFESALRAFLRQDPDIMLIGEIRDLETANIAVKASITGHLVFSTLHTNGAVATVTRLVHMGVAPYLVAASVKLVAAQRLVRDLCPSCKVPGEVSDDEKKFLAEEEVARLRSVWRSAGCPACHQTGYSGRSALFEIMPLDSAAMRQLICAGDKAEELNRLALAEGMTTLRQAALEAVARGTTSLSEALKVMLGG